MHIVRYSNNYTLGFAQDATLFGAGLQSGGSDDWAAAYKALTNPAACSYLYDEPATGQSVNRVTGVGQFAYHVFPGAEAPHIVIKGSNFVYADGRNFTDTHYWLIDKYWEAAADGSKTDVEVTWEPGYVYKITRILVGDTIPTKDPYDDPITVQVTVSVTPWQVTPVFVTPN